MKDKKPRWRTDRGMEIKELASLILLEQDRAPEKLVEEIEKLAPKFDYEEVLYTIEMLESMVGVLKNNLEGREDKI